MALDLLTKLFPQGFQRLPMTIQYCIVGFVGLHLFAIIMVAYMHFTSKKKPEFKSKIN
jgi:uncharacterized membrane protein YuzA (DUF378 family)